MQKKLYRSMTILVTVMLLIFAAVSVTIGLDLYNKSTVAQLQNAAEIMKACDADPSDAAQKLKDTSAADIRVTYIAKDGTVIYDNKEDAAQMGNHLNRKEVADALKDGSGKDERTSETLDTTCVYYAIVYKDGVLRLSTERSSTISIIGSVIACLIAVFGILVIITTIISMKLSELVMKPIHELVKRFGISGDDVDSGIERLTEASDLASDEKLYEELEPVAQTADKLLDETHRIVGRLKKEKEKFSLITENMAEGMILLDSDNTVLSVNRTALQLFNPDYNPSSKLKLLDFTDEPQLWELIGQINENNSARGIIKLGDHSWRTFVNKSEYAGSYGIVIILADVTESIKSEEIRRDFSANVSHELKTPLTTIKGFGEMMEKGIIYESDDVKRYGGTIFRESERLLSLINDIIRLSEIEDEKITSTMENVELKKLAYECEEVLQDKAIRNEISLEIQGEEAAVFGSRSYLMELIVNLMDNSIKYNKAGGYVRVTITPLRNTAQITVSDNGIGISKADCSRVFERFYRVDKSRSKETGGTGLGLSIVKHIVGLHNGQLEINSRLDEGTTITINLPYGQN